MDAVRPLAIAPFGPDEWVFPGCMARIIRPFTHDGKPYWLLLAEYEGHLIECFRLLDDLDLSGLDGEELSWLMLHELSR